MIPRMTNFPRRNCQRHRTRISSAPKSQGYQTEEALGKCVIYENAHQNRTEILRRLKWKAEELREDEE